MTRTASATRPDDHEGRSSMGNNRRLLTLLAATGAVLALAAVGIQSASADPPGTTRPAAGRQEPEPDPLGRRCRRVRGADQRDRDGLQRGPARRHHPVLASYDAVNPVTGATGSGGEHHPQGRLRQPGDPPSERRERRHHRRCWPTRRARSTRTSTASTSCAPAEPRAPRLPSRA